MHGGGNVIAIHLKRYCLNHISPHLFSLQDTLECSSSRLNPPSGYAFTPDRRLESFVHNPHNHGLFHNSDLLLACERSHVLGKQQCRCNQRRSLILACRQLSDALYRSCEQGHPSPLVTPGYRPSHPARFRSRPGGGMCEPARLYRRSDGNVRCRHAEVRRQFERHSLHSLPEYVVPRLAGAYLGCAKMLCSFHQACLATDGGQVGRAGSDSSHLRRSDLGVLPMCRRDGQSLQVQEKAAEFRHRYGGKSLCISAKGTLTKFVCRFLATPIRCPYH